MPVLGVGEGYGSHSAEVPKFSLQHLFLKCLGSKNGKTFCCLKYWRAAVNQKRELWTRWIIGLFLFFGLYVLLVELLGILMLDQEDARPGRTSG